MLISNKFSFYGVYRSILGVDGSLLFASNGDLRRAPKSIMHMRVEGSHYTQAQGLVAIRRVDDDIFIKRAYGGLTRGTGHPLVVGGTR
jgi:hypothetical protein